MCSQCPIYEEKQFAKKMRQFYFIAQLFYQQCCTNPYASEAIASGLAIFGAPMKERKDVFDKNT